MTTYKRKLRSLRRRLLKHLLEVLEGIDKKLEQGESLNPKEMFTMIAGPLAVEQLTCDRLYGEVELEVLKEVFEALGNLKY